MVAVILPPGRSLRSTLSYNENKVALGEKHAVFLHAANYGKDSHELTFNDKLNRLTHQAALNSRVHANSIHVTLSFDSSEKRLAKTTLSAIADKYMRGIGYAYQPYLVYQHLDGGAPHIHIVSTNVQANGVRIKSNNIGKIQSEQTRKALEIEYGLVKAESHRQRQEQQLKPVNVQKVIYGKSETKRAIAGVLKYVLSHYKFSSLPELNAVLRQYNVEADGGTKDSRIFKNNGLVYRVLNERGEKVGVPIKASLFYFKPTLPRLQEKFAENRPLKQPYKQRIKNAIDGAFAHNHKLTLQSLTGQLAKEQIQVIPYRSDNGFLYGLTYIDHNRKVVFTGRDIGPSYSAAGILKRLQEVPKLQIKQDVHQHKIPQNISITKPPVPNNNFYLQAPLLFTNTAVLYEAFQTFFETEYAGTLNPELRDEKRKKHKKRIHNL